MSEEMPVYVTYETLSGEVGALPTGEQQESTTADAVPPGLRRYFERRRESLIMELRMIDRVLGLKQTIPERTR